MSLLAASRPSEGQKLASFSTVLCPFMCLTLCYNTLVTRQIAVIISDLAAKTNVFSAQFYMIISTTGQGPSQGKPSIR